MDGKLNYQTNQSASSVDSRRGRKKSTKAGVLAIIRGIANQVVVQLRLASEFGIPYSQIFSEDFRGLNRKEIERVIVRWLRAEDQGLEKINELSNDLLAHQIAVISGLDGIVKQTLDNLDPEKIKSIDKGMLSSKSKNWNTYTDAFKELNENIVRRHQQIVVPGFVSTYVRARKSQSDNPVKLDEL